VTYKSRKKELVEQSMEINRENIKGAGQFYKGKDKIGKSKKKKRRGGSCKDKDWINRQAYLTPSERFWGEGDQRKEK